MIELLKNLIANLVFIPGYLLFKLGTKLHKVLKTKVGQQIIISEKIELKIKESMAEILEERQAQEVANKSKAYYVKNKPDSGWN